MALYCPGVDCKGEEICRSIYSHRDFSFSDRSCFLFYYNSSFRADLSFGVLGRAYGTDAFCRQLHGLLLEIHPCILVIFELPLVIILLVRFAMATPEQLAKQRRYAVLLAFIAGAVMTPTPDVFNQTLMALPIIVLYKIGILVSRTMRRKSN